MPISNAEHDGPFFLFPSDTSPMQTAWYPFDCSIDEVTPPLDHKTLNCFFLQQLLLVPHLYTQT